MTIEVIHLRKLLQIFFADAKQRRSLLLEDIRAVRRKQETGSVGGHDFYAAFWADVKRHARGEGNLNQLSAARAAANPSRYRLYPILAAHFEYMWREAIRWRNEPFEILSGSIKGRLPIPGTSGIVKVESAVGIQTGDGAHRIVYPYFSETPALPEEGIRLGFWALNKAIPRYPLDTFRIVDFHRRKYWRPSDVSMLGNEGETFTAMYRQLLSEWTALRERGS